MAPANVVSWARHCLAFIDKHLRHFSTPLGPRRLLSHAFSKDVLVKFALAPLSPPASGEPGAWRVRPEDRDVVLKDGEALLRASDFRL